MKYPEETYSDHLSAKARTYFFDVKNTDKRGKALFVTQSRFMNGALQRDRIVISEEELGSFVEHLLRAAAAMGESPSGNDQVARSSTGDRYEKIRLKYPQAYRPWTPADDERLLELSRSGQSVSEIAIEFQRQPSAIRSRLSKLGSNE